MTTNKLGHERASYLLRPADANLEAAGRESDVEWHWCSECCSIGEERHVRKGTARSRKSSQPSSNTDHTVAQSCFDPWMQEDQEVSTASFLGFGR